MKIKFKSILILLNRKMEINGYPNYLIYEDGRVYSNNRRKGFLKPQEIKHGYLRVGLSDSKDRKWFLIHRLVALHYIDNPNNKQYVDHIDRNTQNNHFSNLRWVTAQENMDNRDLISNTGEKYISYDKRYDGYNIRIPNINKWLNKNYTLQDAINVRDSLLG